MKKMIGLAVAAVMLFSGAANAAVYRVDFAGLIDDGTFDGYFTFDDTGLDLNAMNYNFGASFETNLEFNYASTGATGSFDETTAGVYFLEFDNGSLTNWGMGGNATGINGFVQSTGLLDFRLLSPGYSGNSFLQTVNAGPQFALREREWEAVEVSAVPLPAAIWMFGAGALGLLGLRRRKKQEAAALQSA
ncbi:MAG: hypothetical protein COB93_09700 [Sneathiella sp.]|nr:MAG: hypothetical protein COB93_09700 [Sneathiella sp.]